MIKFDRLWKLMKDKGITQYRLIKDYDIEKSQFRRLRKNMVVKTLIIDRLCEIFDCRVEDIMEYVPDDNIDEGKKKNIEQID